MRPKKIKRRRLTVQRVVARLGVDAAITFCEEWGGLRVPRVSPQAIQRLRRDERIRALLDAPASNGVAIGRRERLTPTRIAQIGKACA